MCEVGVGGGWGAICVCVGGGGGGGAFIVSLGGRKDNLIMHLEFSV